MKKILIIVTSHRFLGTTGEATGVWLEECAAPFLYWNRHGIAMTLASPWGGDVPIDPASINAEYALPTVLEALKRTHKLSDIRTGEYDAVYYPGGHGPLWDLAKDMENARVLTEFVETGRLIAAVCHGPSALLCLPPDKLLKGKHVTAFSNEEERLVKKDKIVPFSLEDALRRHGARYSCSTPGTNTSSSTAT